jgi:squalene-hopene/tetraprenyl-beta-curcumene cyclase
MNSLEGNALSGVDSAIRKSVAELLRVQRPDGEWRDYTSSSALATAMCTLCLYFADPVRYATEIRQGCAWLRQTQNADGGWGDAVVDGSNLNATAFALPTLRMIDAEGSATAIERALAFIERHGGKEALGDFQRCSLFVCSLTFMALAQIEGYSWGDVPRMPVGMIFTPKWLWRKVSFGIPAIFALGMLHNRKQRIFPLLRLVNRLAEPHALTWLRKAQGENGGYQESPLLAAVVYIGLHGAGTGHDIAERCLAFIRETRREDGSWTCQRYLDVSVTTFILEALESAGYLETLQHQPINWLFSQQFDAPFFGTDCPAGAWSWGRPSGWADMDDTAGVLTMLLRMGVRADDPHIQLGYRCLEAMQNYDGSWGMFVKQTRFKPYIKGASIDKPCPGLTARIAIALYERDHAFTRPLKRALHYLRSVQRPDGSICTLWYRDFVYGTATALDAFATVGLVNDPAAVRCREWLLAAQNEDGSWGGSRGMAGTVEETAWALSALLAPGLSASVDQLERAATWLVQQQQADGTWKPAVIGVYFPALWYSDDHIANGFALRALGRYWHARTSKKHAFALSGSQTAMMETHAQPECAAQVVWQKAER